jgi:hypothetical protein
LPITFWALGTQTKTAIDNHAQAAIVSSQNTAANALIAGVYNILIERQFVNNALVADGPAKAAALADIATYRDAARSKIEPAFRICSNRLSKKEAVRRSKRSRSRAFYRSRTNRSS